MRQITQCLAIVALGLFAVAAPGAAEVAVRNPWIAEAPPGATAAAAFMVLENDAAEEVSVVAAESPICERIEFHQTEMEGGIARMRQQKSLVVPGGGSLELAPGGTHMMLVRPTALRAGDRVEMTLDLSNGEKLVLEVIVRERAHHSH